MTVQYRFVRTPTLESVQRTETGQQPRIIAKRRMAGRRADNSPLWGRHGVNCLHAARAILCDVLGGDDFPEDLVRCFARWWLEDIEVDRESFYARDVSDWLDDLVVETPGEDLPDVAIVVLQFEDAVHGVR